MPDTGIAWLAIVATVLVAGVVGALIYVVRSRRKHKRPEEEFPSFQEELGLTTKPAPSIAGPEGDFWKLFVGEDTLAGQLRRGGRFSTRAGHRITVNVVGESTVVVVAQSRSAEEVRRYVCHRHSTKGLVGKTELREMQDGHTSDTQAHNTDREGMESVADSEVRGLTALLGDCYPTPVVIR